MLVSWILDGRWRFTMFEAWSVFEGHQELMFVHLVAEKRVHHTHWTAYKLSHGCSKCFFSSQICCKHHLWWQTSLLSLTMFFFFVIQFQELHLTVLCGCWYLPWKCVSISSKWLLSASYQGRWTLHRLTKLYRTEVINQKTYSHKNIWKYWGGHSVFFTKKVVMSDCKKNKISFFVDLYEMSCRALS